MIRITRETDYGVLMLSRMAEQPAGRIHNVRELADWSGLSMSMASKILKPLARYGILASHRGVKGGYSLARSSSEITVGQVVEVLEGPVRITACSSDDATCERHDICPTRKSWQAINGKFLDILQGIPLSEMSGGRKKRRSRTVSGAPGRPEGKGK